MGQGNNIRHLQERRVSGLRLFFKYIETSATNLAFVERSDQSSLINHLTSSNINQDRRGLHPQKRVGANHVMSFSRQRHGDTNEIRLGQEFVHVATQGTELCLKGWFGRRVGITNAHTK